MGKKPANPNKDLNVKTNTAHSPGDVELADTAILNRALEKADPKAVEVRTDQSNTKIHIKEDYI